VVNFFEPEASNTIWLWLRRTLVLLDILLSFTEAYMEAVYCIVRINMKTKKQIE